MPGRFRTTLSTRGWCILIATRAVESCLAGSGNHLIAVPCGNLAAPLPGELKSI